MTDMRAGGASPSIGDLLNSGIDYAKNSKALLPYVAVTLGAMILPVVFGGLGSALGLVCAIGTLFLAVMASRESITGAFAYKDSDLMAVAKLFGLALLAVIALMVLAVPLAYVLGAGWVSVLIFSLVLMALLIAVVARFAYLLPSFAMNDQRTIGQLFEMTASPWMSIIGVMVAAALPNVLFNALFGGVGGAFGVILALIGAAITAFLSLVAIGAISRLYAGRA
jgi:hypothetical protein